MKISLFAACFFMALSCSSTKVNKSSNTMPSCLSEKTETMKAYPSQGEPLSISQYSYKGKTVYYMVRPVAINIILFMTANVMSSAILMEDIQEKEMEKWWIFLRKQPERK
jgi:hypothetical protein